MINVLYPVWRGNSNSPRHGMPFGICETKALVVCLQLVLFIGHLGFFIHFLHPDFGENMRIPNKCMLGFLLSIHSLDLIFSTSLSFLIVSWLLPSNLFFCV